MTYMTELDQYFEERINECAPGAIRLEPAESFDKAIIGIGTQMDSEDCLVYSTPKVLKILEIRNNMTSKEAVEWFHYNILTISAGGGTPPVFVQTL